MPVCSPAAVQCDEEAVQVQGTLQQQTDPELPNQVDDQAPGAQ